MEINIILVSKMCWEVIDRNKITLKNLFTPDISELLDRIDELYPTLYEEDFKIYWRYSATKFLRIKNYFTYITPLLLLVDNTIYLLLEDRDIEDTDIEYYLTRLDRAEEKDAKERTRSKYDVKLKPDPPDNEDYLRDIRPLNSRPENILDMEIIIYATRKMGEAEFYTADLLPKHKLIEDLNQGWPKPKRKLTPLPEEQIAFRVKKPDKKGKKDKKDTKGKDKGKKAGKDAKGKKTGKKK